MSHPLTPLYTTVISLPAAPGVSTYREALRGIEGYRVTDDGTVHLGSQLRYALLGSSAGSTQPTPVSVRFSTVDACTVTATVTPRYTSPFVLPTWTSRNHQLRTAVRVQDALAAPSPSAPTATTRMDATRAELLKGWASALVVGLATALVVLCLIMGLVTQWDVGFIVLFLCFMVVATAVSAWFSVRAQRPVKDPTAVALPH
ncbi:hypothetical protein [Corynebacterium variabile]|uniref:Uncharacterized protein n=1 Tax=Corynebacterium variabile TaxID=1727 RepID=A0A0X2NK41_9CORY|nr:hypothetical protein [Corynebacterium variabile]CUU65119.1 hypothetical protein CVAR292_00434 [Corynebacterium variabile]